jgi:hypothetical protein
VPFEATAACTPNVEEMAFPEVAASTGRATTLEAKWYVLTQASALAFDSGLALAMVCRTGSASAAGPGTVAEWRWASVPDPRVPNLAPARAEIDAVPDSDKHPRAGSSSGTAIA